jgi:hypothetical protein
MASVTARKGPAAQSPPLHPMGGSLKRSSSRASLTDPKPKRKRTKQGCITCRVRGKVSVFVVLGPPKYFLLFYGRVKRLCAGEDQCTRRGRSDRLLRERSREEENRWCCAHILDLETHRFGFCYALWHEWLVDFLAFLPSSLLSRNATNSESTTARPARPANVFACIVLDSKIVDQIGSGYVAPYPDENNSLMRPLLLVVEGKHSRMEKASQGLFVVSRPRQGPCRLRPPSWQCPRRLPDVGRYAS